MFNSRLRVGASRVCITPTPDYFPIEHFRNKATGQPSVFSGVIREDIYLRVITLQSSDDLFVWAVLDLPGVPEAENLVELAAQAAGINVDQVMLTCTHNHSGLYADNPIFEKWFGEGFSSKVRAYRQFLRESLLAAVLCALDSAREARMSVNAGPCYLNVCRNEAALGPDAGTYGFLPGKEVDRTLTTVRFDDAEGRLIALLFNYPVHACAMIHNQPTGRGTEISGDFVGYACRRLEERSSDSAVVAFTSGAAGDLNPLMMARVNIPQQDGTIVTKDLGEGGPAVLEFMGTRLAMDVSRIAQSCSFCDGAPSLRVFRENFMLPRESVVLPGPPGPVTFRVGIMAVGQLRIVLSNGEIFNQIGVRLKDVVNAPCCFMVTHVGPWTGYVKDDSGAGLYELATKEALARMVRAAAL